MDAKLLGTLVGESLASTDSNGDRLRLVRQFIMDSDRLDPAALAKNIAEPAPLTNNRGWDALIAGVVEDIAYRHCVNVPPWTADKDRSTEDRWWFVTTVPALHPVAFVETPASLANRGVFIRRASLVNI